MKSRQLRIAALLWLCLCPTGLSLADGDPHRLDRSLELPRLAEGLTDAAAQNDGDCDIVISARENVPRLVLNTGGPVSAVRRLAFSQDSERLYSAGHDKVVQVWGIQTSPRGIRRTAFNNAVLAQTLRWDVSRGMRGAIYSLAANPVGREVAIGGYSSWTRPWGDAGDVVVFDSARADVVRVLEGHAQVVVGLAYSPDGNRIASLSGDSELRVWSAPDWGSRILRSRTPGETIFPQPIAFLSENVLAAAVSIDEARNRWQIALYDLATPASPPRMLPQLHQVRLTAVQSGPKGRWASADIAGNVYLWNGTRTQEPTLLRKGRAAADLAFAPDGRLFVATMLQNGQAVLELWDPQSRELVDQVQTGVNAHNLAVAVSPDGSRVATCGSDENQVWVFLLRDRDGTPRPKPLSRGNLLRLRGKGRKIWKAAFADDGSYRIGIGTKANSEAKFNDYGEIDVAFDPVKRELDKEAGTDGWRSPDAGAADWSVHPERGGQTLRIQRTGTSGTTIMLDPETQGRAQCYCWIANAEGRPIALAIGTDRQHGVFVYSLPANGRSELLRYYRDHNDRVTSVGVSADGRYLVSASEDQTVKIWSLDGISDETPAAQWGADFEIVDGQVQVVDAIDGGGTSRKGIRVGDVVVEAKFDRRTAELLGKAGGEYVARRPSEILDGLLQVPPTSDLLLTLQRSGKRLNRQTLLKPAWEPLLTLFLDRSGEWALWSPQGFYDASIDGDELFGWQLNRGIHTTPDFFRADQFRGSLERPDVIGRLLETGSLPEAIRQAGAVLTVAADRALIDNLQSAPVVEILAPGDGQMIDSDRVPVSAKVRYPSADAAEQANVRAFVNGVPGPQPQIVGTGRERTYVWEAPSADFYNRVRVSVEGEAPVRLSHFSEVHFSAEGRRQAKPKLHVLALAANDYKGDMLPALQFPIVDAEAIVDTLTSKSKDLYEAGVVRDLRDDRVSPRTVQDAINALKHKLSDARPDDLLVVFMAGHGFAFDDEYYFVPPHPRFASIAPNDDELRIGLKELGVSWTQLRQLSDLPCRKLFLLDTCYSGNVLLAGDSPTHWKSSIRPLKRDEIVVISATDVNQEAVEATALGHGVFTKCLLDGFAGAADTVDNGQVDLREISDYVVREVPRMTRLYREQTPRVSPTELIELLSVPLVRYE